jgi:hypothetical protein
MRSATSELAFTAAVRTGELADEMFAYLQGELHGLADEMLVSLCKADLDPSLPTSEALLVKFSARASEIAADIDSLLEQYRQRLAEVVVIDAELQRERTGRKAN